MTYRTTMIDVEPARHRLDHDGYDRYHLPDDGIAEVGYFPAAPVVGFDGEWTPEDDTRNRVLSYQYSVLYAGKLINGIFYCQDGARAALNDIVGAAMRHAMKVGVIREYPEEVWLTAHMAQADFSALADWGHRRTQMQYIQKGLVSIRGVPVSFVAGARRRHQMNARVYDTKVISPAEGQGLGHLAQLFGIGKAKMPEGVSMDRMDLALRDHPEWFEVYACRDSALSALGVARWYDWCAEHLDTNVPKPTLTSAAESYAVGMLTPEQFQAAMGLYQRTTNERYKRLYGSEAERKKARDAAQGRTPSPWIRLEKYGRTMPREAFEGFARSCFHGGRNEAFMFGPAPEADWTDYDFRGAYAAGMAMLRTPDYANAYTTKDPCHFSPEAMGFAQVAFRFPEGTRFPCLPVEDEVSDHGLVFPLEGVSNCTGPEIDLARRMGADLEVQTGIVVPWTDDHRWLAPYIERTLRYKEEAHQQETERLMAEGMDQEKAEAVAKKQSYERSVWKLLANGLYGKTAQGLGEKTGFDMERGESKPVEETLLTNPYVASYITGFIRGCLGELLWNVPERHEVAQAITDGLVTTCPDEELRRDTALLCAYSGALQATGQPTDPIKQVGHCRNLIVWKTRGYCNLDHKGLLGKGGLKPDRDTEQQMSANAEHLGQTFANLFVHRYPTATILEGSLTPIRKLWNDPSLDLVSEESAKRINMEYDFKRELVEPQFDREVMGAPHLFARSKPWSDIETFRMARQALDNWAQPDRDKATGSYVPGTGNCLKTQDDWEGFQDYLASRDAKRVGGARQSNNASTEAMAGSLVARAHGHGIWGLGGSKQKDLAKAVRQAGATVSRARRRTQPPERSLPLTPAVNELITRVLVVEPQFQWERMVNTNSHWSQKPSEPLLLQFYQRRATEGKESAVEKVQAVVDRLDENPEALSATDSKTLAVAKAMLRGVV